MIQFSKETDEYREGGAQECWCLHGSVGLASDWRSVAKAFAADKIGTRAVDLWRFLECNPLSLPDFAKALNADAGGRVFRGTGRSLLGYSMGGRMALHALLEPDHPWTSAIIVSAHPGLENGTERASRRTTDTEWATQALTSDWGQFMTRWNDQPALGTKAIRDPNLTGALVMRRREIARSFVDWSLGAQEPLWDRLPEIHTPLLWIVGEQDEKFRALAERAVSLIPNARLVVAPGAGHRVPWEAEPWFTQKVSHFLKFGEI